MTRPEDIPEDVWEAGLAAWRKDGCSAPEPNTYARAILAERERCAQRAEAKDREGREWVAGSLFGNIRREIAADIRGGA